MDIDLKDIPERVLELQKTQPILNIMTCGAVSHGKSTLLSALSGEKTGKHSNEKQKNMTIQLGYTSCKIWKCKHCPVPECYFSTHSDLKLTKVRCKCGAKPGNDLYNSDVILIRHLSFVDVPGHAQLMQTMISATSVADTIILVVDSSKHCPDIQTEQHLSAIYTLGLLSGNPMLVAQNKVDLVTMQRACLNCEEIRNCLSRYGEANAPIVPISAQSELNIDLLCMFIVEKLPKFSKKYKQETEKFQMNIIRSFDINKPGIDAENIVGGVLGGAIIKGTIKKNQSIEIRPGLLLKKDSKWAPKPIKTTALSLQYGKKIAEIGYVGGNIGIKTDLDPTLTKANRISGQVVINADDPLPPPIFTKMVLDYTFVNKQVAFGNKENIRVNIGAFKLAGKVMPYHYGNILITLEYPICANIGDSVGICRYNKNKEWRYCASGKIVNARELKID